MYISIHAPRAGCDHPGHAGRVINGNFNPRTPCGVRRHHRIGLPWHCQISIHAPRAGCDPVAGLRTRRCCISIHAPRAGCDPWITPPAPLLPYFNPRTPCGVRHRYLYDKPFVQVFQSTHPVRGATRTDRLPGRADQDFNPRTPCGVRRPVVVLNATSKNFNPRTPCGVRLRTCG